MRPGARSIRGAMGAYALAGALLVSGLALVLWIGGPSAERCNITLPASSRWVAAVLDDGHNQRTLVRGERIEAPPGHYRLTLTDANGHSELRDLQIQQALTTVGE